MNTRSEPTEVTLLVTGILERLGVRYAIGGSLASSLHGVFRASVDADIVADLRLEHVEPFARALGEAFYRDETAMRRAIDERRSFNVIHLDTMFKIDLFVPKGRPFDEAQLRRRSAHVIATDPERSAFVTSAEDSILANSIGTARAARSPSSSGATCSGSSRFNGRRWIENISGPWPVLWK